MNKQSNGTGSRYQHEEMYYLSIESQKGFGPCIRESLIDWLITENTKKQQTKKNDYIGDAEIPTKSCTHFYEKCRKVNTINK